MPRSTGWPARNCGRTAANARSVPPRWSTRPISRCSVATARRNGRTAGICSGVAARAMREVLIDAARRRQAAKRPQHADRVELSEISGSLTAERRLCGVDRMHGGAGADRSTAGQHRLHALLRRPQRRPDRRAPWASRRPPCSASGAWPAPGCSASCRADRRPAPRPARSACLAACRRDARAAHAGEYAPGAVTPALCPLRTAAASFSLNES